MSEVIDLCCDLVRIPSYGGNVADIMQFLKEYLEGNHFSVRLLSYQNSQGKTVQNLCASFGYGHPHFLFVGHADVVSAGNLADWKYPPFEASIHDEVVFGRGIADMKGAIACFLVACKNFIKDEFKGKITLIISGDEEEPIVEGTKKVMEQFQSQGEKFDFALVGEPSNPLNMGDEIKIGRRGDIVLDIISYGQAGHTAYADSLSNPVYNLINLLYAMQQDKLDDGNQFFAPSMMHVTTFDVGNSASNVVPDKARARIDIRFNSEHNYESIEAWANKHILSARGHFELKKEHIGQSFLSDVNDDIRSLRSIIAGKTGHEPIYSTAGGTSDARFIKNYCSVVEYGLTNGTIHKTDECEKVKNIEILCQVYYDFLKYFFDK